MQYIPCNSALLAQEALFLPKKISKKKCVNRDKCSFTTKQRMFGVFAIDEILRYR